MGQANPSLQAAAAGRVEVAQGNRGGWAALGMVVWVAGVVTPVDGRGRLARGGEMERPEREGGLAPQGTAGG